ncbi:MAG: hypothetical protein JST61_05450 [Acidobacteria bacterium]|nr:hypothetical protein [Acidobacteriota bacterium]
MRSRLATVVVLASLVPAIGAAQQPAANTGGVTPPPLHDVLLHLQENLWDYTGNVPNFFADEHVVSVLKQEGARDVKTTTDSVFRLRRSVAIGEPHTFTETREIKSVNKKAAKGGDISGPAIFTGAFSTAVSVVSLEMSRCFDYTLGPMAELNNASALVVDYVINPGVLNDESCPGPEKQSGRAWIDPITFHPLRVEMVIPNHKDNNGIRVLWRWSVDYAPVAFDARQFWMPKTIASNAEANDGSAVWSFVATYSNYHKLTVSSHIVTDVDDKPRAAPPR